MRQKRCFKCGEVKSLDDFYRHPMMGDGHLGKCKTCTKRDVRERYDVKKKDPEWIEKERARCVEKMVRLGPGYAKKFPEKFRARWQLSNAVKRGKVQKPEHCSRCGTHLPRREIHGHHKDYSKPLDVVWLCPPCHTIVERESKQ